MEREPITVADTTTVASLNDDFDIFVSCPCGHEVQIYALWLRRQLGAGVTVGAVRAKLRCRECGGRMPPIKVDRRVD